MRFTILSHAGLAIEAGGVQLVCDPWLIGSTYWRSWWNYPPVSKRLFESLRPDYIYITHVHWDHFQGVTLRRFDRATPILIPREPCGRMYRDLVRMGFTNVVELRHGEATRLGANFVLRSYHFGPFLDSTIVVEAEGRTLFNANDAKVMGPPLRAILNRHGSFDFVLRSHSSANARACFEVMNRPGSPVDDTSRYVADFADFVRAVGARYAIPFASNHCHLHKDVFHFNESVTTPQMVAEHFASQRIQRPAVKVMVSGDSWDEQSGFRIVGKDWFERRSEHLQDYRERKASVLQRTYAREARTDVQLDQVRRYFERALAAMPWLWRRRFRGNVILYVVRAGAGKGDGAATVAAERLFEVDVFRKAVRQVDTYSDATHPIQVHTAAAVLRHCMSQNLFSHLPISKRVRYRVTAEKKHLVSELNLFFNLFEYELLPPRWIWSWRFWGAWLRRWRELLLYVQVTFDVAMRRGIRYSRYLPEPRGGSAPRASSPT